MAATTTAGDNVRLTFSGTTGERVFAHFANNAFGASGSCSVVVSLVKPNGSVLGTGQCIGYGGSINIDTSTLPMDGTYTILVDPQGTNTGSITVTLHDVLPDPVQTITPTQSGTTVTATASALGQNAKVTFDRATTSGRVYIRFTNNQIGTSGGCPVKTFLVAPNGWVVSPNGGVGNCISYGGSLTWDTISLSQDGQYTILVDPQDTNTGSIGITVYDVPADVVGSITIGGPPVPVVTTPGQGAALTFSANAGQQINLRTSESTYVGETVYVRRGSTNIAFRSGTDFTLNSVTLATTATYSVVVVPSGSTGGSLWVTLSPTGSSQYTAAPTVSGLPSTGVTLIGMTQAWSPTPTTFTYQWVSCDVPGLTCNPIAGATDLTYHPTASDVGLRLRIRMTAINGSGSSVGQSLATSPITKIIDRYAPLLHYDSLELWRADSAAEITKNCWQDSDGVLHNNYLKDGTETPRASACSAVNQSLSLDQLSLDYLGSYAGATPDDHIDEANYYYQDAQRLNGLSEYGNKAYGRLLPSGLLGGGQVLQYWFFYYYNQFTFDNHEGDWEMIQLQIDGTGTPWRATYSQHTGAVTCDWGHVQKTSDQHPIVFPGVGSHASFFSPGHHDLPPAAPGDENDGAGDPILLQVLDMPSSGWIDWVGRWGGTDASPSGPEQQGGDKWNHPEDWANNATGCTEYGPLRFSDQRTPSSGRLHRALPSGPPAPVIRAHRVGRRVVVKYTFRTFPLTKSRRPWKILTAVDSAGRRYAPLGKWSLVRGRQGTIVQPLGLGHGPFRVRARVFSKTGASSATVTVPLR